MVRQGPAKHGVPATSFALIDPSDYFFSSLKTLLMPTEPIRAPVGVNVPGLPMAGFQLTLHGRIWVTPEANLAKHHIDFRDAQQVFDGPVFERSDSRRGEDCIVAIGLMEDIEIVVVYVMRGKRRRIISARRAHCDERQDYTNHLRGANQGQD